MSDNAPAAAPASTPTTTGDASGLDQPQGGEKPQSGGTVQAPPKKKAPVFHKFKVGEDEEVALTQEDIERDYKKWKGSDAKFREAAQAKQSVEQFMKALQEDPESVLNDERLPLDRKKLAEKWLVKQIQDELTPPDPRDKKLSEAEKRLKDYEDRDAEAAQTKEQEERAAAVEQRKKGLYDTLKKAGELTHLSANPESEAALIREMAVYMRAARERGEEVTPEELVNHIHNSRFQQFYSLANQFEGEELIEFLGDEVVKRIRKADLARLRTSRESPGQQQHRTESGPSRAPKDRGVKMDAFEAREHANKILLGK